jgi:hypothetical protein
MKLILFVFFGFMLFIACSNGRNNQIIDDQYLKKIDESDPLSFTFVTEKLKLNRYCEEKFRSLVQGFYVGDNNDSILAIYHINAELFDQHYSESENKKYEKYALVVDYGDSTKMEFLVINKKHSMLHWAHYIQKFNILTVDYHMSLVSDFSYLTENKFGQISPVPVSMIETENQFSELRTFDLNSDNNWHIDSISRNGNSRCLFYPNQDFHVQGDSTFIFANDKHLDYYFQDYSLFLIGEKDTITHWIVSWSDNNKIIKDASKNYIFLSK